MADAPKADTTKVTLRRAVTSRGVSYGPGKDVEIPSHIATRLGLDAPKGERKAARSTRKATKGRKTKSAE